MFKYSNLIKKTAKLAVAVSMIIPSALALTKPTQAAENEYIRVPRSYTYYNVHHVKDRSNRYRYANGLQKTMVYDSWWIMNNNGFDDDNSEDQRTIDLRHLSSSDYCELNNYAIALINSVRRQQQLTQWGTNDAIQRVAKTDARYYERDGEGDQNIDGHDTRAVNDAARVNGIHTDYGYNDYEDYTGLWGNHSEMTMYHAKAQVYFAVKTFFTSMNLGDGIYDLNDLANKLNHFSTYFEWDHARDLTKRGYYQVAVSFSHEDDTNTEDFHIYSINPKTDIVNAKKYYQNN